jgi:WD40 repeat protein
VAFSPDGKAVLTGSGDSLGETGEARLWSAATGQPLGPPLQHQGEVTAVAFSPDGKAVLTGSWDSLGKTGEARLWSAATGQPLGPPLQHQGEVTAVAFGPEGEVTAVAFSPDGKALLTVSWNTARLWSAATGQPLGPPLQHQDKVHAVAFSPDGKAVLTAGGDITGGEARLWPLPKALSGEVERIQLWAQVLTGMELDAHGAVSVLDGPTWQQRRRRLDQLGGPPRP